MENMLLTHYTDSRNVEVIREGRVLRCALSLMDRRERSRLAREPRPDSLMVSCGAVLRDQKPLTSGRIVLCDGVKFDEFVRYLNGHVFFWSDKHPSKKYHKNFRGKYRYPKHVGIRCRLADLRDANPRAEILYSPWNSGSTPHAPKSSPRCLNLFQPLPKVGRIAEVVVRGKVNLPKNTEIEYDDGEWRSFFRP